MQPFGAVPSVARRMRRRPSGSVRRVQGSRGFMNGLRPMIRQLLACFQGRDVKKMTVKALVFISFYAESMLTCSRIATKG